MAIVLWIIAIALSALWLWMLINAITSPITNKVVWVIVLVLTGWIGAIIYYFMVFNKGSSGSMPSSNNTPSPPSY